MFIVRRQEMPTGDGFARELAGHAFGVEASLLLVEARPGDGPAMHRHDYPEVIVVQQGEARCFVGGEECTARAGDVIYIAAGEPHRFVSTGDVPLRQVDIHLSARFATQWLDPGRVADRGGADEPARAATP